MYIMLDSMYVTMSISTGLYLNLDLQYANKLHYIISLTHSITHSHTHSPTHSFTHSLTCPLIHIHITQWAIFTYIKLPACINMLHIYSVKSCLVNFSLQLISCMQRFLLDTVFIFTWQVKIFTVEKPEIFSTKFENIVQWQTIITEEKNTCKESHF